MSPSSLKHLYLFTYLFAVNYFLRFVVSIILYYTSAFTVMVHSIEVIKNGFIDNRIWLMYVFMY